MPDNSFVATLKGVVPLTLGAYGYNDFLTIDFLANDGGLSGFSIYDSPAAGTFVKVLNSASSPATTGVIALSATDSINITFSNALYFGGGFYVDNAAFYDSSGPTKIFDTGHIFYDLSGNRILSGQGAAVADASGGAVIDVQCRAQLALLLNRLRAATGHGLIA
jgi:hypothetical protein